MLQSSARLRVDGMRLPGRSCPERMALRNHEYNCTESSCGPLRRRSIPARGMCLAILDMVAARHRDSKWSPTISRNWLLRADQSRNTVDDEPPSRIVFGGKARG